MCPYPIFPTFSEPVIPNRDLVFERIAKGADVPAGSIHAASSVGVLRVGTHDGQPCWSLGSLSGKPAIALRQDGRAWKHSGKREWFSPAGAHELLGSSFINPPNHCGTPAKLVLLQGYRAYLHGCLAWFESELEPASKAIFVPVAFLTRAATFEEVTLTKLAGRSVVVVIPNSELEGRLARGWAKQLQDAGAEVEPFFIGERADPNAPLHVHLMELITAVPAKPLEASRA